MRSAQLNDNPTGGARRAVICCATHAWPLYIGLCCPGAQGGAHLERRASGGRSDRRGRGPAAPAAPGACEAPNAFEAERHARIAANKRQLAALLEDAPTPAHMPAPGRPKRAARAPRARGAPAPDSPGCARPPSSGALADPEGGVSVLVQQAAAGARGGGQARL